MESTVYIETSIVSYLAARPSRDLITAAHQQLTTQWWATRRSAFRLHISELVVQEPPTEIQTRLSSDWPFWKGSRQLP